MNEAKCHNTYNHKRRTFSDKTKERTGGQSVGPINGIRVMSFENVRKRE